MSNWLNELFVESKAPHITLQMRLLSFYKVFVWYWRCKMNCYISCVHLIFHKEWTTCRKYLFLSSYLGHNCCTRIFHDNFTVYKKLSPNEIYVLKCVVQLTKFMEVHIMGCYDYTFLQPYWILIMYKLFPIAINASTG